MKLMLNRTWRKVIIISIVLMLIGSALTTVWWYRQASEASEDLVVFTAKHEAALDYRVFFRPNALFPEQSADPGKVYLFPLTDYINTSIVYHFSAQEACDISGEYQLVAAVTAYETARGESLEDTQKIKVWEKKFPLIPLTHFSAHDKNIKIKNQIPIYLATYADFARQVKEELKYNPSSVELSINYDIKVKGISSAGEISETLAPVMIIPLQGTTYSVGGQLQEQKESVVSSSQMLKRDDVIASRKLFLITTIVLVLILLGILLGTKSIIPDPLEQDLTNIIRRHGDRIVACHGQFDEITAEKLIKLHSFTDLIKVADELNQPILYEAQEDRKHSFYILSEDLLYQYTLQDKLGLASDYDVDFLSEVKEPI